MKEQSKLEFIRKLVSQLKQERESFIPLYRELAEYIDPSRAQFSIEDHNKGDRRNHSIIDSTATFAAEVLGAGLMSGITSPARPWFKLATADPDLAKFSKVNQWLQQVQEIMTATHNRSNLNSTLPNTYKDAGTFATSPFLVAEDFTGNVIHTTPFDLGTYMIAEDHLGRINTFVREFRMTVQQLVDMFGEKKNGKADWSNFSSIVRNAYERGNTEQWVEVTHVISPNRKFDPKKASSKFKKFSSSYFENSQPSGEGIFLREKGYDLFPVLGLRWNSKAGDVYGTSCPGIMSLGDIKQLQHFELRSAEGIDKMNRPPMKMSAMLKETGANLTPGGVTWVDEGANIIMEPSYTVRFPFQEVEIKSSQIRARIDAAFSKNLFLMLANDQRSNITATEINARYEEKLVMLGPVLQQFNSDGLDPFIDLSFDYHLRQGLLPPPPEELRGMPLKIEYISVIAQAQKTLGINTHDRFLTFVGNAAGINPEIIDKVDFDEMTDTYGDQLSINPKILRPREVVEQIRQGRAQAQQAQAQAQMAQQQSQAARNLSQADLEGDNALTAMMGAEA